MIKFTVFIFVTFGLASCSYKAFPRETELRSLWKDKIQVSWPEDGYITVIQNGVCSACQEATFDLIWKQLEKSNHQTDIIVTGNPDKIKTRTQKLNARVWLISIDDVHQYGVSQVSSIFFQINRGQIVYWKNIEDENISQILHAIQKNSYK
jgi:hypothetical protein